MPEEEPGEFPGLLNRIDADILSALFLIAGELRAARKQIAFRDAVWELMKYWPDVVDALKGKAQLPAERMPQPPGTN